MKLKPQNRLNIGIIGLGAIGQKVALNIENGYAGNSQVVSILCRNKAKNVQANADQSEKFRSLITDCKNTFFSTQPDIIIEAAGQDTLNHYGPDILGKGIDLIVSSIGLFSDDVILNEFISISEQTGAKIMLSAGALPAIDWMSAASLSKVSKVSMTQTKPISSWRNTSAEKFIDLDQIDIPTCFFEGTAREAANIFPKSSNISAMLALATIGLDLTDVRLIADPVQHTMHTDIEFDSDVGKLKVHWQGVPSLLAPSKSADVPFAITKTVKNLSSSIFYGV